MVVILLYIDDFVKVSKLVAYLLTLFQKYARFSVAYPYFKSVLDYTNYQ